MTTRASRLRARAILGVLHHVDFGVTPNETAMLRSQATTQALGPRISHLISRFPGRDVAIAERMIDAGDHGLRLRTYVPPLGGAPRPLIVYFHGGGWSLGGLALNDWLCASMARDVGAVVLSVDYRMAPQYRHPAQVDDCCAAVRWASEHRPELGVTSEAIGLAGDSAGGHLAAAVALRCRDDGSPVHHQALIYPAVDLALTGDSIVTNGDIAVLREPDVRAFAAMLLGERDGHDPGVSPLYADHHDLPPATIIVGELDPLLDDARRYAAALLAAGGEVTLRTWPLLPHGFLSTPRLFPESREAVDVITAEQRRHLLPA